MLGLFRDSGHTDLKLDSLVPADVGMHERTGVDRIDRFFDRLSALVAVTFLANHTWTAEGDIHYRMVGYKVINGVISAGALLDATPALVQIAQWCYADGGQSDKVRMRLLRWACPSSLLECVDAKSGADGHLLMAVCAHRHPASRLPGAVPRR
jgi:hypothetical protein